MKVWLFDHIVWPKPGQRTLMPYPGTLWEPRLGMETYEAHLRYFQRGDELGFDGVCLAEHHFKPFGTCPSPNVMAAAVARETSHARIVLLGNCLPMHGHPVRMAEELAMVDVLSKGRLVSGFLRGGSTEWFAYNVEIDEIRGRFEEAWDLIVKCWTEPQPFAWHGQYYDYDNVAIMPRPVQQPHPPIMMAANTAESLEWCARRRIPVASSFATTDSMKETFDYYRRYAQEECGWTPGPEYFMVSRQVYCAPTNEQAREEVEEHILTAFQELPPARQLPPEVEKYRQAGRTERSHAYKSQGHHMPEGRVKTYTYEGIQRDGLCIMGDPEHVTREMKRQQEILGVGTFLIFAPFATLPMSSAMNSIELMAKEVLPHLREPSDAAPDALERQLLVPSA
jgi:alkanesulfonate monooxygenase SsuD/methylene tetrahydromethanopterin reductase-like flavin-dependent oxidoreductase (luciferase family)